MVVDNDYMMNENCPFCSLMYGSDQREFTRIIGYNDEFIAIRDRYPVTPGHTLLIPRRHIETPFELWGDEMLALNRIMRRQKQIIQAEDSSVEGFNIGFNVGTPAGQTVPHAHCHLIPRREGDVEDPIGGIRNVIPGKGNYIMKKVNKQQAFQELIEERMQAGITYMDAMVEYMTEHQLEPKQVARLISPAFLEKVTKEAVDNNVIKEDEEPGSVLPL